MDWAIVKNLGELSDDFGGAMLWRGLQPSFSLPGQDWTLQKPRGILMKQLSDVARTLLCSVLPPETFLSRTVCRSPEVVEFAMSLQTDSLTVAARKRSLPIPVPDAKRAQIIFLPAVARPREFGVSAL